VGLYRLELCKKNKKGKATNKKGKGGKPRKKKKRGTHKGEKSGARQGVVNKWSVCYKGEGKKKIVKNVKKPEGEK